MGLTIPDAILRTVFSLLLRVRLDSIVMLNFKKLDSWTNDASALDSIATTLPNSARMLQFILSDCEVPG